MFRINNNIEGYYNIKSGLDEGKSRIEPCTTKVRKTGYSIVKGGVYDYWVPGTSMCETGVSRVSKEISPEYNLESPLEKLMPIFVKNHLTSQDSGIQISFRSYDYNINSIILFDLLKLDSLEDDVILDEFPELKEKLGKKYCIDSEKERGFYVYKEGSDKCSLVASSAYPIIMIESPIKFASEENLRKDIPPYLNVVEDTVNAIYDIYGVNSDSEQVLETKSFGELPPYERSKIEKLCDWIGIYYPPNFKKLNAAAGI
ncbi:MAG: hypothetical protein KAT28_03180 [Candidatus Aenigmarchaeota archaeon]|nr:hypothetical protein [Candidatus Aenigmarchaeota archaeon]